MLFPVQDMKTAELNLPFKWRKTSADNNYVLKIYDAEAKELASFPVKDTSIVVDLTSYVSRPGKYYWRIQSDEANCEDDTPLAFQIISKEEENKIESAFQKIDASLMTQLAMVEILEKENMIWAAKKYLELLASKNNDPALAKTYSWFLLKYHFDEEAKKIWESISPAGR